MTGNTLIGGAGLVLAAVLGASHLPPPFATPSADNPPRELQVAPARNGPAPPVIK